MLRRCRVAGVGVGVGVGVGADVVEESSGRVLGRQQAVVVAEVPDLSLRCLAVRVIRVCLQRRDTASDTVTAVTGMTQ